MQAPDRIDIDGVAFIFYREHFPFGDFAGYVSFDKRFRFWANNRAMTPQELADYLTAEYSQVSEAGIRKAIGDATSVVSYPALRAMAS